MPGMILAVEDEPSVMLFLEAGLGERGYEVIGARSGGEALNLLGCGLYDIDVLVADIRIGDGIDGWEIARCARDISPDLPIVYITGDSAEDWEEQGVTNSRLLQKPFTRLQLAGAIEELMARAA